MFKFLKYLWLSLIGATVINEEDVSVDSTNISNTCADDCTPAVKSDGERESKMACLDLAVVKEWSEREIVLRKGMKDGEEENDIEIMQQLLNIFLDDDLSYPLDEDGAFGKLSANAVYTYQQYRLLLPDSVVGGDTKKDMYKAYKNKWTDRDLYKITTDQGKVKVYGYYEPKAGAFPVPTYGEVSFFGGANDPDDRCEGQAYLLRGNTKTPKEFAEKHPKLVEMGIIRKDCLEIDEYPCLMCYGKISKCGTSWTLDQDNGYYCAIKTDGALGMYDENNPKVIVISPDGHVGVFLRGDYGPLGRLGNIDVGYVGQKDMQLKHDDLVIIGWASRDEPVGYKGKIIR